MIELKSESIFVSREIRQPSEFWVKGRKTARKNPVMFQEVSFDMAVSVYKNSKKSFLHNRSVHLTQTIFRWIQRVFVRTLGVTLQISWLARTKEIPLGTFNDRDRLQTGHQLPVVDGEPH